MMKFKRGQKVMVVCGFSYYPGTFVREVKYPSQTYAIVKDAVSGAEHSHHIEQVIES